MVLMISSHLIFCAILVYLTALPQCKISCFRLEDHCDRNV